ncbi:hypothetical protein CYMTET_22901 [Cymbomonas tetramitiformis]|uniref:Uncharacterized protein n=1 Tax=Cymbomonas tetramitiformis TaxID=36881 RepID=A0AAE0FYZ9_9CHLO|nr:hypothetical protein CYMTET_22901 [Cymbomonas tetramitiformis]
MRERSQDATSLLDTWSPAALPNTPRVASLLSGLEVIRKEADMRPSRVVSPDVMFSRYILLRARARGAHAGDRLKPVGVPHEGTPRRARVGHRLERASVLLTGTSRRTLNPTSALPKLPRNTLLNTPPLLTTFPRRYRTLCGCPHNRSEPRGATACIACAGTGVPSHVVPPPASRVLVRPSHVVPPPAPRGVLVRALPSHVRVPPPLSLCVKVSAQRATWCHRPASLVLVRAFNHGATRLHRGGAITGVLSHVVPPL